MKLLKKNTELKNNLTLCLALKNIKIIYSAAFGASWAA
jgi:hypothetical protein